MNVVMMAMNASNHFLDLVYDVETRISIEVLFVSEKSSGSNRRLLITYSMHQPKIETMGLFPSHVHTGM
jgi:hypothetical protein